MVAWSLGRQILSCSSKVNISECHLLSQHPLTIAAAIWKFQTDHLWCWLNNIRCQTDFLVFIVECFPLFSVFVVSFYREIFETPTTETTTTSPDLEAELRNDDQITACPQVRFFLAFLKAFSWFLSHNFWRTSRRANS